MKERVHKIIAAAGIAARRKAETLIAEGRVTVNGQPVKVGDKADPALDDIRVDGKDIRVNRKVYLAFHKPSGCLVSAVPTEGKKTIYDVVAFPEKVFYVGRLDYTTEGLLLMTNDGTFSNRVTHPSFNTEKTYVAGVSKTITPNDLEFINNGLDIDDRKVEAKARALDDKTMEITLHEGRKHIVKRLLGKLGYGVFSLKRTRIGNIRLGDLPSGQWRTLTEAEMKGILEKK